MRILCWHCAQRRKIYEWPFFCEDCGVELHVP